MDIIYFILAISLVYILYRLYKTWDEKHPFITIVNGKGKGQRLRIRIVKGGTITTYKNFKMQPDATYTYIFEEK